MREGQPWIRAALIPNASSSSYPGGTEATLATAALDVWMDAKPICEGRDGLRGPVVDVDATAT